MTKSMQDLVTTIKNNYPNNQKLVKMFEKTLKNTYETTIKPQEDGTTFVITGDIPAMWLRDSAAQVRPLLLLADKDDDIKGILKGLINRHKSQILADPYANAFNLEPDNSGHHDDKTKMQPIVWERKYEIDSLCYPIELAYLYYHNTNDGSIFDSQFLKVMKTIVKTFKVEQNHEKDSNYRFERTNKGILADPSRVKYETLPRNGKGTKTAYTGMTWSGFRPSDDATQYGYLVPSNMFAVVILKYMESIIDNFYNNQKAFKNEVTSLKNAIDQGINNYGIIDDETFGKVYAYEVDGLGNYSLMDDANVPSLLSAPYLGYTSFDNEIYQNTRKLLLSKKNPYFYKGQIASGIGSPHTPKNYIWHISLAIQGLTALNNNEKENILNTFLKTDGDTHMMHEGFDVDNPENFTRPWFSWANSMFAEFVLSKINIVVKGSALYNYLNH